MDHVLFIITANGFGGAEVNFLTLVPKFAEQYNVSVIYQNEKIGGELNRLGIEAFSIKPFKKGINLYYNLRGIRNVIVNFKPNKIITITNLSAFYLTFFSKSFFKSINIVIEIHDFRWIFKNFILKYRIKKAVIVLPNQSLLEIDCNLKSILRKRNVNIIPNAVSAGDECNEKLRISDFILFVAFVAKCKGIEYILDALYLERELNLKLVVCGSFVDKSYELEIQKRVKELNLSENVIFVGYTTQISAYYKECLFAVITTISKYGGPETFGRTIIEAWKNRKTVCAFNCGGPKYLIDDNKNGLLVQEENVEELSKKIKLLVIDSELRNTLSNNGYEEYSKHYKTEKIFEQYQKLLTS
jgi:glycosyltransferase involved in cell wall biosynthesis